MTEVRTSSDQRTDTVRPDTGYPTTGSARAVNPHGAGAAGQHVARETTLGSRTGAVQSWLASIFESYAEVLFLNGTVPGVVFAAATFLRPNVGLCGLLAIVAAYVFARLIGMDRSFLQTGFCTYNPLLVGLGLGSFLSITATTVFFVAAMGIFTLIVTVATAHVFRTFLRLPALSLPFVGCMMVAYLATLRYPNLVLSTGSPGLWLETFPQLPVVVDSFLRSLGAILFVPHPLAGAGIAAMLLFRSRILFGLAVSGFASGVWLRSLLLGSSQQALADLSSFNFMLIAIAVGGVFLVPSITSYVLAFVAIAVSTVLLDATTVFWSWFGIPAYTLPFNVVAMGFIYTLGVVEFRGIPAVLGRTPEETLDLSLSTRWRFPGSYRTLRLPFVGTWTVWQGFDGPWTHTGPGRYAYDFVINDSDGSTYSGTGARLSDYHCFQKPVSSPIRGRVVKVVTDLPDNHPGEVDSVNNWGNLVLIHDERGFYVELSHFSRDSIKVHEGEWVEPGTVVGLCGNSGYSPQPHVHVQVQITSQTGAVTLPFSFTSYISEGTFESDGTPAVDSQVTSAAADSPFDALTEFLLDDVLVYEVHHNDRLVDELRLSVHIAVDGTLYFESGRGGRLYFGKSNGTFYFYRTEGADPWLPLFQQALPRLPLTWQPGLEWTDSLAAGLVTRGLPRAVVQSVSMFVPEIARLRCRLRFEDQDTVNCRIDASRFSGPIESHTTFDEHKGFARIEVGPYQLRRKSYVHG